MAADERLFERFIAIDWSGAKKNPNLAVAEVSASGPRGEPWSWKEIRSCVVDIERSRKNMLAYLEDKLRPEQPRTLVMVDSGFTYPYGTAKAFLPDQAQPSWRDLVGYIGATYREVGSARAVGRFINQRFDPDEPHHSGPFRGSDSRNAPDFHVEHDVGYFRQVEMLSPQALSQFWLGPYGAVGFSTISFLETLDSLMGSRDAGELDFEVWVHETFDASGHKHIIGETYPALFKPRFESEWPKGDAYQELDGHERDAAACLHWVRSLSDEQLADFLQARECPVGRYSGTTWQEQLAFEGWILGVPWPE